MQLREEGLADIIVLFNLNLIGSKVGVTSLIYDNCLYFLRISLMFMIATIFRDCKKSSSSPRTMILNALDILTTLFLPISILIDRHHTKDLFNQVFDNLICFCIFYKIRTKLKK